MKEIPISNRFWPKVNKSGAIVRSELGPCWLWIARCDKDGYGRIRANGKPGTAHRVSWEIHNGPIPAGLCVLHHCDNPPCVRPDHLFLGTHHDNNVDMTVKERATVKLSNAQVAEARNTYASGQVGYGQLAERYGVSRSGMRDIISKRRRAHA